MKLGLSDFRRAVLWFNNSFSLSSLYSLCRCVLLILRTRQPTPSEFPKSDVFTRTSPQVDEMGLSPTLDLHALTKARSDVAGTRIVL